LKILGAVNGHWLVPFGLMAYITASACTSTIALDYLKSGQCAAGQKLCNDVCVSAQLPEFGCADPGSCVPCDLLNATARCERDGTCAIATCIGTNVDCNSTPGDGCEIDIRHDKDHCGDCSALPCIVPNATPDCAAGRCAIRSCNDGFEDCNENATDGCETNLETDSANCSQCGQACLPGMTCSAGTCG
jgi:hypothetical protein